MTKRSRLPLILGACVALALLLAGGLFVLFQDSPPTSRPSPIAGNPTPRQQQPELQQPVPEPEATVPAPAKATERSDEPAPADIDPRRVNVPLPPAPPAIMPRPPAEGGEGEIITPAWRHDDLTGQAMQVHRDLELTLRLLHELLR